jgi:hypothetical protein
MMDIVQLSHLDLLQLKQRLKTILRQFSDIHFKHIFRESNIATNSLSKVTLLKNDNVVMWEKHLEVP